MSKPEFGEELPLPRDQIIMIGGQHVQVDEATANAYRKMLQQYSKPKLTWAGQLLGWVVLAVVVGPFVVLLWKWVLGL